MEYCSKIMLLLISFSCFLCLVVCAKSSAAKVPKSQGAKQFYLDELLERHDTDKNGVLSFGEFDSAVDTFINECQADLETAEGEIFPVYCSGDFSDANYTSCINRMCPDGRSLYNVYGLSPDRTVGPGLLSRLLPAVVYAVSRGNCHRQNATVSRHLKPTQAETWGYSLAFATLINLVSNVGVFLIPFMNKTYYKLLLMFMVALAVGCMTGTALFVLMPEAYDLMNIPETADTYLWKAGTVVFIIYFFFLVERVMNLIVLGKRRRKDMKIRRDVSMTVESTSTEKKPLPEDQNGVGSHGHSHGLEMGADGKPRVATVAWMVLAGDALHNFMDGLAIGAGFTESVILGLSISIAVICEEIPHELGDIAILVHSGLGAKKALFYNCLAAAVCYGGIVVGVFLGENTSANQWVYAAASGMFLYVSLVDMLPEVNRTGDSDEGQALGPIRVCFIQNIGLIVGLSAIFLLANYSGSFFE